jgi:hypothetical protein
MPVANELSEGDHIRLPNGTTGTFVSLRTLRADPIGETPAAEVRVELDHGSSSRLRIDSVDEFIPLFLGREGGETVCEYDATTNYPPRAEEVTSTHVELACKAVGRDLEDIPIFRGSGRWTDSKGGDFVARTTNKSRIYVDSPDGTSYKFIPEPLRLDWDLENARRVRDKFRSPLDSPRRFSGFIGRVFDAACPYHLDPADITQEDFNALLKRLGLPAQIDPTAEWQNDEPSLFFESDDFLTCSFWVSYNGRTDKWSGGGTQSR